jgi:hypothetical protein
MKTVVTIKKEKGRLRRPPFKLYYAGEVNQLLRAAREQLELEGDFETEANALRAIEAEVSKRFAEALKKLP